MGWRELRADNIVAGGVLSGLFDCLLFFEAGCFWRWFGFSYLIDLDVCSFGRRHWANSITTLYGF